MPDQLWKMHIDRIARINDIFSKPLTQSGIMDMMAYNSLKQVLKDTSSLKCNIEA